MASLDTVAETLLTKLRYVVIRREHSLTVSPGPHRLTWPDIARGMAIVLVVLHHTIQWLILEDAIPIYWSPVTEFLRTLRMPLFFCISGIFAASWVSRRSWRELLANKIVLLFWVYMVWCVVRWVYFLFAPRRGTQEPFYFSRLVAAPLWPTNELWFLYALVVFFIAAKLMVKFRGFNLFLAALVSIVALSGVVTFPNGAIEGVCSYYFFFLLGLYGKKYLLTWVPRVTLASLVFLACAWGSLYAAFHFFDLQHLPGVEVLLRVFGTATGLALAVNFSRIRGTKWLAWLGQNTLPVYVSHVLWIVPLVVVFAKVSPGRESVVANFYPIAVCLMAVCFSLVIWKVLRKLHLELMYAPPSIVTKIVSRLVGEDSVEPRNGQRGRVGGGISSPAGERSD